MEQLRECYTLRTTVSSQLMRHTLFKGFAIACLGVFVLTLAGLYANVSLLESWGFFLILISLGLITVGLLPYRKLSQLQLNPNELCLVNMEVLEFYSKSQKILTIPLKALEKLEYVNNPFDYGIVVHLKKNSNSPVIVHQNKKMVDFFRKKAQRIGDADLFFPYFNHRAFQELLEWRCEANQTINTC